MNGQVKLVTNENFANGGEVLAMPTLLKVRFVTDNGHVDVSLQDGRLQILGSSAIDVRPIGANAITVDVVDWLPKA
jgi:hypothetical protein